MAARIEDYALIGDCETAALIGRDGSIDWLCLPRFDSDSCFAALLDGTESGRWLLAPAEQPRHVRRRYRGDSLVLETQFDLGDAKVNVVDFMPARTDDPVLVRIVEGVSGSVRMNMELILRFGYGRIVPWVRATEDGIQAVGGPDSVSLYSDVELQGESFRTVADFVVSAGERVAFSLLWFDSFRDPPVHPDAAELLEQTVAWWKEWASRSTYEGRWREAVVRSLITLKALTYAPTGGIVAAPTTSLPELIGGNRNWDYRYCWVRDATMTLFALLSAGYTEEAAAWREWLLRAAAGSPADLQIAYGIRGERRLTEIELGWLSGYESSKPVRIGNAAYEQFQLDVYGELIDAMYQSRQHGIAPEEPAWGLEVALVEFLESAWMQPDEGIWEVRGGRQNFTHSKVMAWVAVDRAIKSIERLGLAGPLDRWREVRKAVFDDVCTHGFDERLNSFVQFYGSDQLDAALLMIPLVGFLPIDDPRVAGTVRAIEKRLFVDGFVRRYSTLDTVDGLPPGEGVFLPCSFWLADCYVLAHRRDDAERLFTRLLDLRNDVGLLAEEYDPLSARQIGNFPQALSHIGLVNTACNLSHEEASAKKRSAR